MMQLLTILLATTFLFTATQSKKQFMGMSYDIIPNKQVTCANDFENTLSFFFEQVGGYGETAEVEQVSKILKIDLSVFQDIDYDYENQSDIEKHWHSIDSFTLIVNTFIDCIKAKPDYYKLVHHNLADRNKQLAEENRLWQLTDTLERDKKLAILQQQPYYYYPPDYGYLSTGKILKDLQALKKTLDCYKKNGVTKIRLTYV